MFPPPSPSPLEEGEEEGEGESHVLYMKPTSSQFKPDY